MRILFSVLLFALLLAAKAQSPTVGLIQHDAGSTDDGYVLFAPIPSYTTYLIDKCGREVFEWTSNYTPGFSAYLLPDGNLLRTGKTNNPYFVDGGSGGIIEKFDWNNNVVWSYFISDSNQCQHHDIRELPNGNILALCWEKKKNAEAIAAGRNPVGLGNFLWSEKIMELQPIGTDSANIVWEWHLWDHIVQDFDNTKYNYGNIAANPQLANINFPPNSNFSDWVHLNDVAYNPALDQIIVSSLFFSELWVIDHSTTTTQAAGHAGGNSGKGGDLLYRWGNPVAYHHGNPQSRKFYRVHDAHWIENGFPHANGIMAFNNGMGRPNGNYSSVEILSPPVDSLGNYSNSLPYLPDSSFWKYEAPVPTDFFSATISGAQQLQNGNVLICNGDSGNFFEINSAKTKVWEYINPVTADSIYSQGSVPSNNTVFRCIFYPSSYSGFSGQPLTPGLPVELNPWPDSCSLIVNVPKIASIKDIAVFPNPANDKIAIENSALNNKGSIFIYNIQGQLVMQQPIQQEKTGINISNLAKGLYFLRIESEGGVVVSKFVKE